MAISPPPKPSLPKEAPWKEVEAIISGLGGISAQLESLLVRMGVASPGAPGVPGGLVVPGGVGVDELRKVAGEWTQPAAEVGIATAGSTTQLFDNTKDWVNGQFLGLYLRVVKPNGTVHVRTITQNVNNQIIFTPAIGEGIAAGDIYGVRSDPKAIFNVWPSEDMWSPIVPQIVISDVPTDIALPSVYTGGFPSNQSVKLAIAFLKFRTIENTNGVVNYLDGAQVIQAKNATVTVPPYSWTTAIALDDGVLAVPANTRENGDVFIGSPNGDISSQVENPFQTILFQWTQALALSHDLNLNDVQMGIRVWYSPS